MADSTSTQDGPSKDRRTVYHRIAGGSVDRLAALSDGIFAVTLTLLVLDLHVPVAEEAHRQAPIWQDGSVDAERALWSVLQHVGPSALAFALSFLTLGMFWVGQQTQLNHVTRSDRELTWLHLAFLLGVCFMPFSTGLLAEYMTFRIAIVVYWLNLLLLGGLLLACLRYADRAGLLREDRDPGMRRSTERRIVIAQVLYFVCVLISLVNTYVGIGLIVLLQLNSAIAPRIRPFDRF
ncbi:TMEM175 family protein [Actinoplanes sp. HUAS TT8]|uniref:TMEM175 family protein n=1 Tax=Actinoplanes sp. HUAS TT8 TaxID=3447453 RepID=UPI003F527D3C